MTDTRSWNEALEKPPEIPKPPTRRTTNDTIQLTPERRRFLFMHLSDSSIMAAAAGEAPPWTTLFPDALTVRANRVYFEGLPVLLKEERKDVIKAAYFDPKQPVSVFGIHGTLQTEYANITRRNVTGILRSLEVYQRLMPRKLPNKVTGRIEIYSPGYLAADTIYPSPKNGWPKGTAILCVIDCWSRYCGAYLLGDKRADTVSRAFSLFVESYRSHCNVPPRSLMIDKGSELRGLDKVMEKHCTKRPCVFRSLTGTPVNLIENFNAQFQRMCQVYREAQLVSDFDDVIWLVCNAINHQRRKDRMSYTPLELLQMNKPMRTEVNANYKFRAVMGAEKDPVDIGTNVRLLMLNRKEQVSDKTKGFPAHWSKETYQVYDRKKIARNRGRFKYLLKSNSTKERLGGGRFRHELLRIQVKLNEIDSEIPSVEIEKVPENRYWVEGSGDDALYDPANDW